MALKKHFLKTRPACKVTFHVSPAQAQGALSIVLAGDFNQWSVRRHPMRRLKDGGFSLTLELPAGRSFRFRYCAHGDRWFNDDAADGYSFCALAQDDNSVLILS
ncbi:MAG: isoamylase early set domain-containing protein [Desulfovibrionaceae bacterium]